MYAFKMFLYLFALTSYAPLPIQNVDLTILSLQSVNYIKTDCMSIF